MSKTRAVTIAGLIAVLLATTACHRHFYRHHHRHHGHYLSDQSAPVPGPTDRVRDLS